MSINDRQQILSIYQLGLETRNATFETKVPSWESWNKNHLQHSRFVYEDNDLVIGWVALSPVSKREVYKGVSEVSIYIDPEQSGKGIGSLLMKELIHSSEKEGIWTLYSSIFPENKATIALHKKFGFREIGVREKIAKLDGVWRDTLLLERRSKKIGII